MKVARRERTLKGPAVLAPECLIACDELRLCAALYALWCPDDGRPAAALRAAREHIRAPNPATYRRLKAARSEIQAAVRLARAASPKQADPWDAAWLASTGARAIDLFMGMLLAHGTPRASSVAEELRAFHEFLEQVLK